jgi:molybdenum cofactor cytidylyltransferase
VTYGSLVIAAGFSRRFGSDKRIFKLNTGEALLVACLRPYRTVFPNVAVVVRSTDSELARLISRTFDRSAPIIVPTDQAEQGMAASIADGIRALASWDYVFLGLADMPYIRVDTLRTLRDRMNDARSDMLPRIVVPVFRGETGHPVGFSRDFFGELIALTGDRGARSIIAAHPERVERVDIDDPGIVTDIDEPPQ